MPFGNWPLNLLVAKHYDFDTTKYVIKSSEEIDFLKTQDVIYDENLMRKSGMYRYNKREKVKMKPVSKEEQQKILNGISVETGELNSISGKLEVLIKPFRNYTKRKELDCVKCIRVRHSNRH